MIGTLARKRTNLTALAVLAALAVALFAVIQYASADGHTVSIAFNDSDGIVVDGANVAATVTISVTSVDEPDDNGISLDWVRVSGELSGAEVTGADADQTGSGLTDWKETAEDSGVWTASFGPVDLINPKGASHGDYTVSAQVTRGTDDGDERVGSKVLTVGEAGAPLASAVIGYGKYTPQDVDGPDDEASTVEDNIPLALCGAAGPTDTPDDASASFTSEICLFVQSLNSLGEETDDPVISEIVVSAPTGVIKPVDADNNAVSTTNTDFGNNSLSFPVADASPKLFFTVSKGSEGTVDVSVIVIGAGTAGFASVGPESLTFSGTADVFEVADAASTLHNSTIADAVADDDGDGTDTTTDPPQTAANADTDPNDETDPPTVKLLVTAVDKAGNSADPLVGGYTITIKDADDKAVAPSKISATQPTKGADNKTNITITGYGTATVPLATGEYTVEVKLGANSDTASFTVSGSAANIDLAIENTTVAVGEVVTVTATVTDADGNKVIEKTPVDFEVAGALTLKLLGADTDGSVGAGTKDGVASARALVTMGSGSAAFVVSTGTVYETITVSTDAADAADEAVSLACLSATNGFATYTCDMDSSASELFGLVSGRGATAVHLWNGSDWVRYSVVDGAMVPGSSDFTVTEDDILYISN